jgi:hypothetical protein
MTGMVSIILSILLFTAFVIVVLELAYKAQKSSCYLTKARMRLHKHRIEQCERMMRIK